MLLTFSSYVLYSMLYGKLCYNQADDCSGGQVVEDVLTSGLSAKLMRYLRLRVLGEAGTSQKDANSQFDSKSSSAILSVRGREEARARVRQAPESSQFDIPRVLEDGGSDDQVADWDHDRGLGRQLHEEHWVDGEPPGSITGDNDMYEAETEGEEKCSARDSRDGRSKFGGKSSRDEELDEGVRDELSRRKTNRGTARFRGKGRANEGTLENEQMLTSPGSGIKLAGQSRNVKDRSLSRTQDLRKIPDTKKTIGRTGNDDLLLERDESDDCFQGCIIGSKDITELVRKAVLAAEAEARAVNAPAEAIKAAGDAAAELVKCAALEVGLTRVLENLCLPVF